MCPLHVSTVPQKSFDKRTKQTDKQIPELYFQATGAQQPMQDRTPEQKRQFQFAMGESMLLGSHTQLKPALLIHRADADPSCRVVLQ